MPVSKVLIIDNYDSYTYNLYQYVGEILSDWEQQFEVIVRRNDAISAGEIVEGGFHRIVISPGPGDPSDKAYFGVCEEVLLKIGKTVPVLGVCLGMQGMAHVYGGKVIRASYPMHGKTSRIIHDKQGVFSGLPQNIEVMRYHSLIADPESLPDCFLVTAAVSTFEDDETKDVYTNDFLQNISLNNSQKSASAVVIPEIMGLRHKEFPIEGIQFHPESFATEGGIEMVRNFLLERVY
jgi:anthranilate synthase component II